MAAISPPTKDTIKSYFESGDVPSESNFSDLIDSSYNNVKSAYAFGAKGDVQTDTTAAITSGSTTLTITNPLFSAGDVGKLIGVDDGTLNGPPIGGTIVTFNSTTSVEISVASPSTVVDGKVSWGTDDTLALQAALDEQGILEVPKATFFTSQLTISADENHADEVFGHGGDSILKRVPNEDKFDRTLSTGTVFNGMTDSKVLRIHNLTLDGSYGLQDENESPTYNREQQHNIFLSTNETTRLGGGRLRVQIDNVLSKDTFGDGIAVHKAVRLELNNYLGWDCFRGAVTMLGGDCDILISNIIAGGNRWDSGLDLESSSNGPITGTKQCDVHVTNAIIQGDLDLAAQDASNMFISNLRCGGGPLNLYGEGGSFLHMSNCQIRHTRTPVIREWARLKMDNVTMIAGVDDTNPTEIHGFNFSFGAGGSQPTGLNWELNNCTALLDEPQGNYIGATSFRGVTFPNTDAGANNRVTFNNLTVIGFNQGVRGNHGVECVLRNTTIQDLAGAASSCFYFTGITAQPSKAEIDGLTIQGADPNNYILIGSVDVGSVNITNKNIVLTESQDTIAGTGGGQVTAAVWSGRRDIIATAAPTGGSVFNDNYLLDEASYFAAASTDPVRWAARTTHASASTYVELEQKP